MNNHKKQKHSPRTALVFCIASLLTILLGACRGSSAENAPTPTPLPTPVAVEKPTYVVQRGSVVNSFEFTGRVSPVTEQDLFFKSGGYVRDLFVARGDQVKAGDVLAVLEIGDLENQLAQAQVAQQTAETTLDKATLDNEDALAEARISLEQAKTQLERTQKQDVNSAVVIARVNKEQAEYALADAQEAYDRAWEPARDWELFMTDPTGTPPYNTGPSLKDQLEAERNGTEHGLSAAKANLEIVQAQYNQALAAYNTHGYDVELLTQDITLAEQRIAQLERGVDPLLELNVEKARLDIQRIQDQMKDAQLIAPFDGEILSLNIKAGSLAEAFQAAIVLGDPNELEVTAQLTADELRQISVDQQALVSLRDRPGEELEGYVRQLPYSLGSGTDKEEDTRIHIALKDKTELKLGELAVVTIMLEQKDDVLWLPPAALRTFQGRDFVVIQQDGRQQRVDVRLGIKSDEQVEIQEGVEEGQTIVGQ